MNMRHRIVTLMTALAIVLTAMAQATQPCIVKQYNQKQAKTPLAGVQVEVRDAGTVASASDGTLTLKFATLKPGDKVTMRRVTKTGYEIFNKTAIDQWNISRNQQRFEIVLVQSAYFTQLKSKLTQSSTDNYKKKYEQEKAEKERLLKTGKLKEAEYRQQLNDLEDQYDNALKNLDNYIDQFARIDLSEVSEEEQRILEMVEQGKIDEAVKAYEELDISGMLRQARENVKAIDEGIEKLEDKRNQELQAIADLKERQKREIATLKLAGGKDNYDKVARMMKENALADTTDINAVWEYASFAHYQKDFKEAERFYLICFNGSKGDLYQKTTFQNDLGILYSDLHDYAKAEKYYLKAQENYILLFSQYPEIYRSKLATIQNNLGNLYLNLHNQNKAEEFYIKALENFSILSVQNPDAYRADLATSQNNLGVLYENLHDYTKAEAYYLMALENSTQLFNQNPEAFRIDITKSYNNLALLYYNLHDYAKAEKFRLKTLENYTYLFNHNPNAYRADLATAQHNLGLLYESLQNYDKAEKYYLMALENKNQLFAHSPDAFRESLANTQNSLGTLYGKYYHDNTKSEEYYLKALENYTLLYTQNPHVYRSELAMTQNNLAVLYKNSNNYPKAEEYYLKALENFTQLFSKEPETYRVNLANTQNSLGALFYTSNNNAKAEEYYLKALENFTLLYSNDPDTYLLNLTMTQSNLTLLYGILEKWEKYDEMLDQALKNCELLYKKDPRYKSKVEDLRKRKELRKK